MTKKVALKNIKALAKNLPEDTYETRHWNTELREYEFETHMRNHYRRLKRAFLRHGIVGIHAYFSQYNMEVRYA